MGLISVTTYKPQHTICTWMHETGYLHITDMWMKGDHYMALHCHARSMSKRVILQNPHTLLVSKAEAQRAD